MRNNYIEILNNKVEIPIIQRDYAQGRIDNKTNKIRKDFLDVLFDFISKKQLNPKAEIELDFIYGFNEKDSSNQITFIPIDGQQRLTTLFLFHWYIINQSKQKRIFQQATPQPPWHGLRCWSSLLHSSS